MGPVEENFPAVAKATIDDAGCILRWWYAQFTQTADCYWTLSGKSLDKTLKKTLVAIVVADNSTKQNQRCFMLLEIDFTPIFIYIWI